MKKILIAESIRRFLDEHDTVLGRGSVDLYTADSSEEMLALQRALKTDLIIVDHSLPVMDGVALCAAIRSDDDLKDVSIIMAREGVDAARPPVQNAGANAIIQKPVDPAELYSRISELLIVPLRKDLRSLLHVSVNDRERGNTFLGVSCNISISGMLLEAEQELRKGDRIKIAFTIGTREIVTESVVTRIEAPTSEKYQHGIKFLNIDTKALVLIEQFVKGSVKH